MTVTAKDLGTGKSQHVSIQPNGGLSKEEIEKLKKEAELHAEEDNRAAALAEAKNKAESLVYNVEKQIKDNADKSKYLNDSLFFFFHYLLEEILFGILIVIIN